MVSIDYFILFHKSMYVMTQLQYFSCNLATIWVSELQMSFVPFTQTDVHVVYLKFLQMSILKISYCDLLTLCHSIYIIYCLTPILSNF